MCHRYVGKFVRKSDRVLANPDIKYTNLYVKNLDPEIGEEHLQEKFSEFGKISSMIISRDENGVSRGFGFINFENSDDAKRALETLNGSQLGTKYTFLSPLFSTRLFNFNSINVTMGLSLSGSKVIYIARAQKKTEREEVLRRHYEEKCKEQVLKYKVPFKTRPFHSWYNYSLFLLTNNIFLSHRDQMCM